MTLARIDRKQTSIIIIAFLFALFLFNGCVCGGGAQVVEMTTSTTIPDAISSWAFVDGGGATGINKNTATSAYSPKLTEFNSKLYVIWRENYYYPSAFSQIRVAVYNGNDSIPGWTFVDGGRDGGINKNIAKDAEHHQLTVFNSKLYAIWDEDDASNINQIRVAVYNGNDSSPSWSFVDGNGVAGINKNTAKDAYTPQLTEFNSKLYVTWYEGPTYGQIRVAVYNGNDSSPSWSFVDGNGEGGINNNTARPAVVPQLTEFNSKLYATWSEWWGNKDNVRVAAYNGNDSSPSWSFVNGIFVDENEEEKGINKNTVRDADHPQLTEFNSKLYAIWDEDYFSASIHVHQIRVAVYNGNDSIPGWSFVDGNGVTGINKNTAKTANRPKLTEFNSKLYAIWEEYDSSDVPQIRVAVYNGDDSGPSWSFVDGNGTAGLNKNSAEIAERPQLTEYNSKLYATWSEDDASGRSQIRVAVGTISNSSSTTTTSTTTYSSSTTTTTTTTSTTTTTTATTMVIAYLAIANDQVAVVNTAIHSIESVVNVGTYPLDIAVNPAGSFAYVANWSSNSISVINTANNSVEATVSVGDYPEGIAVDPDGTKIYVANYGSDSVSVINASSNTVTNTITVGDGPRAIVAAETANGTHIYVANYWGGTVTDINSANSSIEANIPTGLGPADITASADGSKVYVANYGSDTVSVIDTSTNTTTESISIYEPWAISINSAGTRLYVAGRQEDAESYLTVIDLSNNNTILASISISDGGQEAPNDVALSPDGDFAYACSSNLMSVINTSNNTVSASFEAETDVKAAVIFNRR